MPIVIGSPWAASGFFAAHSMFDLNSPAPLPLSASSDVSTAPQPAVPPDEPPAVEPAVVAAPPAVVAAPAAVVAEPPAAVVAGPAAAAGACPPEVGPPAVVRDGLLAGPHPPTRTTVP